MLSKVATDRVVILGRHLERLERETVPQRLAHVALLPSIQERVVIRWIGQDAHPCVVLGCRSEEGDTPDVDLFDGVRERAAGLRDGLRERVEVADDDGDLGDGLLCEVALVGLDIACENAYCKSMSQTWTGDWGRERDNGYLRGRQGGGS